MELGAESGIIDHATTDHEDARAASGEQGDGCSGLGYVTRRTFRYINIFSISSCNVIETDVHARCIHEIGGEKGEEGSANEQ